MKTVYAQVEYSPEAERPKVTFIRRSRMPKNKSRYDEFGELSYAYIDAYVADEEGTAIYKY